MRNKTAWAVISLLLIAGFTVAGAILLGRQSLIGLFLLVAAVIVAKDLAALSAASKARAIRREAYLASGVWRTVSPAAVGAGSSMVTIPGDGYFQGAFSSAPLVNPATGFAMVGNIPGVDLVGNLYGHTTIDGSPAGSTLDASWPDTSLDLDSSSFTGGD